MLLSNKILIGFLLPFTIICLFIGIGLFGIAVWSAESYGGSAEEYAMGGVICLGLGAVFLLITLHIFRHPNNEHFKWGDEL